MNLFEVVKANINTQEAAQAYGIDVNHYGMALCPFHNDRRPSLYVSDDHYHCFACGEHGDVIDLTAKLFDLRLYDAARKLASDFHLAPDKPLPEAIRRKKKHKTKAQQLRENEQLCFSVLNQYRRLLLDWEKTVCTTSAGRCVGRAVCGSLPPVALGRVSAGHPDARRFL